MLETRNFHQCKRVGDWLRSFYATCWLACFFLHALADWLCQETDKPASDWSRHWARIVCCLVPKYEGQVIKLFSSTTRSYKLHIIRLFLQCTQLNEKQANKQTNKQKTLLRLVVYNNAVYLYSLFGYFKTLPYLLHNLKSCFLLFFLFPGDFRWFLCAILPRKTTKRYGPLA